MIDDKKTKALIFSGLFIIVLSFGDEYGKFISNKIKFITGSTFLILGIISLIINYKKEKKSNRNN